MPNLVVISAGALGPDGITTLVWGTGGALRAINGVNSAVNAFAGEGFYTVESVDEAQDVDPKHGTNGTGIKSWRMLLIHGKKINITVQDDTTMIPPAVGQTVTIIDYLLDKTTTLICKIIDNNYRAAKEVPGQRILQAENLTLVDPQ